MEPTAVIAAEAARTHRRDSRSNQRQGGGREQAQPFHPAAVLPIVQYSDVLCYRINGLALNQTFNLTHLNPVLTAMGLPVEANVKVAGSDKLCVPVAKNGFFPPTGVSTDP
jgi:hypothetical protein